ncbi:MAG: LPS assembly lipoprotein LptE [Pirellulales bacterium]|nr:LPS assembly lipoprotein LptE [Pirellulales bacterium]
MYRLLQRGSQIAGSKWRKFLSTFDTRANKSLIAIAVVQLALLGFGGCASYQVGSSTLYAPDITTVYVPMIESNSYRRDLGERLTEAVVKEIELNTPYKVVGTPDADSILSARLVNDTKRVILENQNDDPRAIEMAVLAEITWLNRRRQPYGAPHRIGLPPELLPIGNNSTLIPEAGQSVATAQQQAIERLAQQIVSTMEEPW